MPKFWKIHWFFILYLYYFTSIEAEMAKNRVAELKKELEIHKKEELKQK